ncbi:MAG TPA: hypothetical protein VNO30_28765 [Kofleriaceae bacterium]|nr:hypothetical protein [Kofleriaceae bacterium]
MRSSGALYAALFAIGLLVYGLFAWDRIGRQSAAPHFVYQADAWLHGELAIRPSCGPCGPDLACEPEPPPCAGRQTPLPNDDWAFVETVVRKDGTEVRGRRLATRRAFRTLGGDELPLEEIATSRGYTAYVSFPPVPTILMLPGVLVAGRGADDVVPTLLCAALILPLTLLVLRRLAAAGLSARTVREDLWLVALLAFGSVLFFSAVQGKVWYTAHVAGIVLALLYAWASIEVQRPILAGIALGAAALTRTSMAFMLPLFVLEAWRMARREAGPSAARAAVLRRMWRPLLRCAAPIAAFAVIGMIYNAVRFGSPLEFGHSYLALGNHQPVYQQTQIEQWGLAHYHYLSRNLAVALAGLPELLPRAPWIQISGHGLALWVTTPALLLLLWPREQNALHRPLLLSAALVALPSLLYMNSGWFQFGYRFSLDYLAFFVMLLAIGGRPLTRAVKALIIAGIVINAFGAATFDRHGQFYRGAINVVVPN